MLLRRGDRLELIDTSTEAQEGDLVEFAIDLDHREQARAWLTSTGWTPDEAEATLGTAQGAGG
jgi:hypothetical protein